MKIHYIHIKPTEKTNKTVLPLLLLHGWPGSIREFYDIFPLLTKGNSSSNFVFEVIAPCMPGYGFSQGSAKIGCGPAEIAVVLRNLMHRLGHDKFLVQGGDWGSIIGSNVATLFPSNVIGYHSNFATIHTTLATVKLIIASWWPSAFIDNRYVSFVFPVIAKMKILLSEMGYFWVQSTKPDTIGTIQPNH